MLSGSLCFLKWTYFWASECPLDHPHMPGSVGRNTRQVPLAIASPASLALEMSGFGSAEEAQFDLSEELLRLRFPMMLTEAFWTPTIRVQS